MDVKSCQRYIPDLDQDILKLQPSNTFSTLRINEVCERPPNVWRNAKQHLRLCSALVGISHKGGHAVLFMLLSLLPEL